MQAVRLQSGQLGATADRSGRDGNTCFKPIHDAGFDLIFEQFDGLGGNIVESMSTGHYHSDDRGTFVGIKVNQPRSYRAGRPESGVVLR